MYNEVINDSIDTFRPYHMYDKINECRNILPWVLMPKFDFNRSSFLKKINEFMNSCTCSGLESADADLECEWVTVHRKESVFQRGKAFA